VSSATGRKTEHRKGVGSIPPTAEAKPSGLPGHAFAASTAQRLAFKQQHKHTTAESLQSE
jgi:hypothetical protein